MNIDDATAAIVERTTRRIAKAQPKLDVVPIAREVARLVVEHAQDDPRVIWTAGGAARIVVRHVLPPAAKQTMEGRVARFQSALSAELAKAGFEWSRGYYRRVVP